MSLMEDSDAVIGPDPQIVCQLTDAIAEALSDTVIPNITTQADILSALFTVLARALEAARNHEDPKDARTNAAEIGRILSTLLMEFGAETLQ